MGQAPSPDVDRYFAKIADTAAVGGKARSLARLAAAGLPTPRGFVVTDALFRSLCPDPIPDLTAMNRALATAPFPPGFTAGLARRLEGLGAERFCVRSSFAAEDEPGQVAAGIYESRIAIGTGDVPGAIRQVLASAISPAAAAYAKTHGMPVAGPHLALLIHGHVDGDARGGAAAWQEAGTPTPRIVIDPTQTDPGIGAEARATITRAASLLAQRHGPIELEWTARGPDVTFLQLRPYTPAAPAPPPSAWPGWRDLAIGDSWTRWSWDAAHNPLPLSAAHAGLVALVDQTCNIGIRQRVLGGYLFWSRQLTAPNAADAVAPDDLPAAIDRIAATVSEERAAWAEPPPLEAALAFFLVHYQALLGPLPPAMRRGRADLDQFVAEHFPGEEPSLLPALLAGVESRENLRRRRADDLARATTTAAIDRARAAYLSDFGDEAPIWDVACPLHRERPDLLAVGADPAVASAPAGPIWQATRDQLAERLAPVERDRFAHLVTTARHAVAAGEDDDWLYARIQAPVRQAILSIGQQLVHQGALDRIDDVFDLDLAIVRAVARGDRFVPGALRALAAHGKQAHADAQLAPPPLPGADLARFPADLGVGPAVVQGHGCGGHAVGKVVLRHGPAGRIPPADAILLATSLLPTELPLLRVAASITETGGPLGHVATQARERGLPAVVGAAGALALLREGDLVIVDGAAGTVTRIGGAGSWDLQLSRG